PSSCANCLRAPRLLSNFSSFIKSTIELFQSRSSSCSSASFARIASTSAFEIGFAAVAPAAVPADAEVAGDEGGGEDDPAAAVTPAACLEPKMADTMLPKTLIFSSCASLPSRSSRHRGLVPAHLPRRIVERFSDLIAVSLMTGICKHRALSDPATTTSRLYLGNCIVVVPRNCVIID